MKLQIIFLFIFLILPLAYAGTYGGGIYGQGLYSATDLDGDNVSDSSDTLLYSEENISTSGINNLNITIDGSLIQENYNGTKEVLFYDGASILVNFTYNFSSSNVLDLSKIEIKKSSSYLIVNFSNQLEGNKTLYFDDAGFSSLCVKDAEISSVEEISSSCSGTNETDFSSCLGNSLGVTLNGVTCLDEGSTLKFENLRHSGIKGTLSETVTTSSGSSSSGPTKKKVECTENSECGENEYCFNSKCNPAQCFDNSVCNVEEGETCFDYRCVKLFDMVILDFESPINLGEFFEFTYFIKGMANISGDVEINFWVENENEIVTSGKDTIYLGSFEEKTKTAKLFLPSNVQSGVYTFRIEVSYGTYTAKSHRTIEIAVSETGIATIKDISKDKKFNLLIIIFITLLIIVFVLFILFERKNISFFLKNLFKRFKKKKIKFIKKSKLKKSRILKRKYPRYTKKGIRISYK